MNQPASIQSNPRHKRRWGLLVVVLIIAAVAGVLWQRNQASAATANKAEAVPATLEFNSTDIATVAVQALSRSISISGSLQPVKQSVVKAAIAGEVMRLAVREGDAVRQGDVIAEIASTDLRSRLDAALADQAERRARLAVALNNRNTNQSLLVQKFISKNAFDQMQGNYEAAEAAVRWADAQVTLARKALADAVVRAPIAGQVAKRQVNAGERVGADAPLVTLVDLSQMELEVTVPASDVPEIHIGQSVLFGVDGFGARQFAGRVDRINPQTETASRAIKLFIAVPNPDTSLKGGMFAQGEVMLSRAAPTPVVPSSAVFEEAGQSYVFAIADGKLVKQAISIGMKDEVTGLTAVTSGLAEGAQVVRIRMPSLKAGVPAVLKMAAIATNAPATTKP
jgi:membrane fusion protein (multidrug efflux system)